MSASDVDLKKVFKILFLGLIASLLGMGYLWSIGVEGWQTCAKGGLGGGLLFVYANLAEAGMVLPSVENLRK